MDEFYKILDRMIGCIMEDKNVSCQSEIFDDLPLKFWIFGYFF